MFFQPVGNLKQPLGLYLSDGLIEILAGFAVERAEQFAVPVDEKFINCRTFEKDSLIRYSCFKTWVKRYSII